MKILEMMTGSLRNGVNTSQFEIRAMPGLWIALIITYHSLALLSSLRFDTTTPVFVHACRDCPPVHLPEYVFFLWDAGVCKICSGSTIGCVIGSTVRPSIVPDIPIATAPTSVHSWLADNPINQSAPSMVGPTTTELAPRR